MAKHEITRVRHELHRRTLTVRKTEYITPKMLRLTLAGEDLKGFTSLSPDDHLKVFMAGEDAVMRDYTPRYYDATKNELRIEFAMHDAGPVTTWARNAKAGDTVQVGGPRGSMVIPLDFDWWLLIGDETALPAIGRRLEELPAGTPVTSIVTVTGPEEEQSFTTKAKHEAIWVHRPAEEASDPSSLLKALAKFKAPAGEGFIWAATEGAVARALRQHIANTMKHPNAWRRVSGYWTQGKADSSDKE